MATQAFHSRLEDLPMFFSDSMTDVAVQYPRDMFPVGEREVKNFDFCIFKSLVTFAALRMGCFNVFWQRDGTFGVACGTGCLLSFVTFKASLFWGTKCGWIVGIMVNIIMARGTGVFQLVDMKTVRNRDIVRIETWGSSIDIKNMGMTTDTVWIDLVKFSRETCMLSPAFQREDIDARHQGMASRVTLRTVDLGMQGGLFPKG